MYSKLLSSSIFRIDVAVLEQRPSNFIHTAVSRRYAQIQTNRQRPEAPFEFITLHSSVGTWLPTVTLRSAAPVAPCTYWRACANNSHTFGKGYHIHGVPAARHCKLADRRGGWTVDAGPVGLEVLFRDAEEIQYFMFWFRREKLTTR